MADSRSKMAGSRPKMVVSLPKMADCSPKMAVSLYKMAVLVKKWRTLEFIMCVTYRPPGRRLLPTEIYVLYILDIASKMADYCP